jgi:hypothetical protein
MIRRTNGLHMFNSILEEFFMHLRSETYRYHRALQMLVQLRIDGQNLFTVKYLLLTAAEKLIQPSGIGRPYPIVVSVVRIMVDCYVSLNIRRRQKVMRKKLMLSTLLFIRTIISAMRNCYDYNS